MENNLLLRGDCILGMHEMDSNSVDLTLTDIPYDAVNRSSNGLRLLDKGDADILTFDLEIFLSEVFRVTKNTVIIFCGKEQFSYIYGFFAAQKGTVRPIIWEKSNPSPMNGQYIYLSGVEMGVWFKKPGTKSFNAHCKNTVFKFSNGKSKFHPTEKNHDLIKELVLDNSLPEEIIFDPCAGSGTHLLVSKNNNRNYFGFELNQGYYDLALSRLN